jgi:hypothetical protein
MYLKQINANAFILEDKIESELKKHLAFKTGLFEIVEELPKEYDILVFSAGE